MRHVNPLFPFATKFENTTEFVSADKTFNISDYMSHANDPHTDNVANGAKPKEQISNNPQRRTPTAHQYVCIHTSHACMCP